MFHLLRAIWWKRTHFNDCFPWRIHTMPNVMSSDFELHCPMTWDGALCWQSSRTNTLNYQNCPKYVFGFNHRGKWS
jgi:hypothetical protein